jgi:pyridoxal phosphate enzyme (YggS family)
VRARTEAGIRERLAQVHEDVAAALERSGRGLGETRILVASKYYEPAQKQEIFGDRFEWHFIGHLQRRRAKTVVSRVSLIHSVDSVRLIQELAKRVPDGTAVEVLFQINVSGEDSKYGVPEDEVEALLETAAETEGKVRAKGFMTLAPLVEDPEDVRYVFAKLRAIRDRLRQIWSPHFDLSELSMGMSGDYEVAVEEGATLVRIGRTLMGEDGP